jgi:hypothetical protein
MRSPSYIIGGKVRDQPFFFTFFTNAGHETPTPAMVAAGGKQGYSPTEWQTYTIPNAQAQPWQPGCEFEQSWLGDGNRQREVRQKFLLDDLGSHLAVNGVWVGYYPASLFKNRTKNLAESANSVHFYGEVYDSKEPHPEITQTDMGAANSQSVDGHGRRSFVV